MASIPAEIKRGALRTIYRQAGDGVALSDILDTFQSGAFSSISSGRTITAHSANGKSTTFAVPQIWEAFSQTDWFALTEELQQIYSDCKADFVAAGTATPTDDQIFDAMMADIRLQTVTDSYKSHACLRYG